MGAMASQFTSLTIVYSAVYSGANRRKHQSSASLAFVRGIHRWPVNSAPKWPVTRKMFPFDDVIMQKETYSFKCYLVARFANEFLPAIQIRWKLHLVVNESLTRSLLRLQMLATTAQLSYHGQNFVSTILLELYIKYCMVMVRWRPSTSEAGLRNIDKNVIWVLQERKV